MTSFEVSHSKRIRSSTIKEAVAGSLIEKAPTCFQNFQKKIPPDRDSVD